MKRGVVMSIHKQHAVVMTADGQFLQAPIQGMPQIGEEIIFEEEYKKPRTVKPVYWYGSAAAIIMVLFLPLLLIMQRDAHPVVAYVSMDINPSVELGVDENEKVRELRALNEDGEQIIKGLQFEGVNVETVAAAILERAKGSHYLDTPNKDIFITSVLLGDPSALKLDYENILTGKVDETLRALLTNLAAEAASANITTMSIPNEVREEASANGISSGKMAVYLMAKEEGYSIEIEQLKQQSIDKITEPIGGVKTIVDNAEDKSKEKLKELVAKEKAEKAKQQKADQSNAVKPSATPKSNKPVKAAKPEQPVTSTSAKPSETAKPGKNGEWDKKPTVTPGKTNKPDRPNRPNTDKQDDKYGDQDDNRNQDRNNDDEDNGRDNDDRNGRNNDQKDDKEKDSKSDDKQRDKDNDKKNDNENN
ncbi:anti-sigma-I factor RsgI family protein [Paenibacillus sp. LPE1-1-1.1]|uniref:anti-sigma-I factor RsgI family protein n=1 Tax=Paenibacillus sp. LPE1-1-1.1 TaxID=3135230 RepID=UPI00341672CF